MIRDIYNEFKPIKWHFIAMFIALLLIMLVSQYFWYLNFKECRHAGFSFRYCITRK